MAAPRAAPTMPMTKVEIRVSCTGLQDKDITSKSDPCCVLQMMSGGQWVEVSRTERIKNCLDPRFTKTFEVDYYFEEVQKLKFGIFDIDNDTTRLDDDDDLGSMECTLGQVVSNSPFTQTLKTKKGGNAGKGKITIVAEEIQGSKEVLYCNFSAHKLDKKDFLSKSDPYLEISRFGKDNQWQVVHRTEVKENTLNPTWRAFKLPVSALCYGDYSRQIKFDCYDYDDDGSHDLIGTFTTTLTDMCKAVDKPLDCFDHDDDDSNDLIGTVTLTTQELMQAVDRPVEWPCINPKKQAKKKSYQNSGIITLKSVEVLKEYSFLDFIFGGLQINFTVGIDFTGSNGNPQHVNSLHYINPHTPNEYMKAIMAVGDVIQDYDSDKMFPALGFGAKVPPDWTVSHEFAVNFNMSNPFCAGIPGVIEAYRNCINTVQLYGPTNIAPIIYHVARFAQAAQQQGGAANYYVLLLLTDGVITDMNDTLSAIVFASGLPMSLIIVGIGEADFGPMNFLDGDDGVLRAPNGQQAARDIVQFVPFRDFKSAPPAQLARHVLAELPKQVVDYYRAFKISPAPRPPTQGVQDIKLT